ncbi:MAG: hypothetical protein OXU20_26720 [Myxococcales bacterium]|nr:hypothetical protein [Myxococcales bacterium]
MELPLQLSLLACGMLTGCAASVVPDARPLHAEDGCVPAIGRRPEAHACQHTEFGPFIDVSGAPDGVEPPDISYSARAFVVDTHSGVTVSYRPSRDGIHTVLFGPAPFLHILDEQGGEVEATPVETTDCMWFDGAYVARFAAGTRYTIRFEGDAGLEVRGFIEYLETFGEDAWARTCP